MKFSVNMLTWNGAQFIRDALLSVLPYTDEALVIDTGSTDGTMEILKLLKPHYPQLIFDQNNVQHLGPIWTGSEKDKMLTWLLNRMKEWTTGKWILKIDDDEIYPPELMEEIIALNPTFPIYSIPFIHEGGSGQKHLIKRFYQNTPEVSWNGHYGTETLALNGKRLSSKDCPSLWNHFTHLGGLRVNFADRPHRYETL